MNFFLSLALILTAAKLFAVGAKRCNTPPVVGELLAGIVLGPSLFDWIQLTPLISHVAELGVILLLFEVGLDSNFEVLKQVRQSALRVASVGFILPLLLALPLNLFIFHLPVLEALFMAGALTATSIGITVRVLTDLKRRNSNEANIVIAAAIFDDILGVALLVLLLGLAGAATNSLSSVIETGFILFAFFLGLALSGQLKFKQYCSPWMHPLISLISSVFFVMVGVSINLKVIAWNSAWIWGLFIALFIVAFIGKFLAGFVIKASRKIQASIGLSMLPRGEVGLIFAQLGLQSGVLNLAEYTVLILVVVATTFLAPFLLRWSYY